VPRARNIQPRVGEAAVLAEWQTFKVDEVVVSTSDLLDAWREAMRAAELAERLARLAEAAAEDADESAAASEEIARLAERAAVAAANAAQSARNSADRTASIAKERRDGASHTLDIERGSWQAETIAKDEYHRAEEESRGGHDE
jgi:multidrug efflux pump subunit AcrA (membrane-fusion protein)